MKSITCLLAAGILLLPASGMAAEQEAEIHAVMSAEETHEAAEETPHAPAVEEKAHGEASAAAEKEQTESPAAPESALDQEMDAVGSEEEAPAPRAKETAARAEKAVTETTPAEKQAAETDAATAAATETGAAAATAAPAEPQSPADANDADKAAIAAAAAAKREAYGKETAIEPVTLKDGDWVFIEGDERRGWFFDRSHMKRNADGSVSYWQLILYNNLGRAQFAEAMKNADYEHLGYTMQRRVLSPKKDAISTYEILAYDGNSALITESSREGHRAVIRANTMTEKERDAVRQELRRKK